MKLTINEINLSNRTEEKIRSNDHAKEWEDVKQHILRGETFKIYTEENVKYSTWQDRMNNTTINNGINDVIIIVKLEENYAKLICNYKCIYTKRGIVTELYVKIFILLRSKLDNGIEVGNDPYEKIDNIESFMSSIQSIIKVPGFINEYMDTKDILKAINLYSEIVNKIEEENSLVIPTKSAISKKIVRKVDTKGLSTDIKNKVLKFKNFRFIHEEDKSMIPESWYSSEKFVVVSFAVEKYNKGLNKILGSIIKTNGELQISNSSRITIDEDFAALIDFDMKREKKGGVLEFVFKEKDEYEKKDFIHVFDKLSKIKSKTMLSVVKDIENNRINNNNLFQFLFNDGSISLVSRIENWVKIDWDIERFNEEQRRAFELSIDDYPITFIQGPPGTGKTEIITEISKYYDSLGMNVLLSSQTNVAVENILQKLSDDLTFHNVALKADKKNSDFNINNYPNIIAEKLNNLFGWEKSDFGKVSINGTLSKSRIIGSTTTSSSLSNRQWKAFSDDVDVLIIDEISKSSVPELIRFVIKSKKIILVGDQRQLAPLSEFDDDELSKYDEGERKLISEFINVSIFDKLFEKMITRKRAITLKENYRSVKSICDIYSMFYEKGLEPHRSDNDSNIMWKDNVGRGPFQFVAVNEALESKVGHSRKNIAEAEAINNELIQLGESIENSNDLTVAIIATYGAQVGQIRNSVNLNLLRNKYFKNVKVNTVDAFQGDQADIVIISTVLADKSRGYGFISDYRRLNVAISRAKDLVLVFGNDFLLKDIPFHNFPADETKYFFNDIFRRIGMKNIKVIRGGSK